MTDNQTWSTVQEAQETLCQLLTSARHEVCIATPTLWREVFDDPDVLEALKRFALSSQQATVRLQVAHTRDWQTSGHRWLPLIQRLPSRFELREFQPDFWDRNGFVEHQVFADRSLAWCVSTEVPLWGMSSHDRADLVKLWQGEFQARARHTREPSHLRRLT